MELVFLRLLFGGAAFLLLLLGIVLLLSKRRAANPRMQSCLGMALLLIAGAMICLYVDLFSPGHLVIRLLESAIALLAMAGCFEIIYHLFLRPVKSDAAGAGADVIRVAPAADKSDAAADKAVTAAAPDESVVAEDNADTEADDEDPDSVTPSEDNMQDLIFFQRLEALMAKKKLFSEPELTRDEVAAEIGTNRTYLIRSIKMATGMTFNEYINSLRTNYAATLLTTTNEPLDAIGDIAGFRSKSAYYRAFAAANHCSPSEYRAKTVKVESAF